jgi:HAD superfamily hydrolase (TIGR01509 family)
MIAPHPDATARSGRPPGAEIGAVLLDLDGVLVDSEGLSAAALVAELAAAGVTVTPERVRRRFLGRSFPTVAGELRREHGAAIPDDLEARYRRRLFASFEAGLDVTPGLRPALDALAPPCRVATSSTPQRARRALEAAGLWGRFAGRVDTASEVARGKPAPDLFLLSARRLGVPPHRCLVIEDSPPGIAAAAAAGMPSLLYLGGAHHAGRPWEGPAPSLGALRRWTDLGALLPGLVGPPR